MVPTGATTVWSWLAGPQVHDHATLRAAMSTTPEISVAIGPSERGISGFRSSHEAAVAARRLAEDMPVPAQVMAYSDIALVSLLTQDKQRMVFFIQDTLGRLAEARPTNQVLRDTLRTYLGLGGDIGQVARRHHAHRNTIRRRIARANELLPRPLTDHRLNVAVALEAIHVLGPSPSRRNGHPSHRDRATAT